MISYGGIILSEKKPHTQPQNKKKSIQHIFCYRYNFLNFLASIKLYHHYDSFENNFFQFHTVFVSF